MNPPTTAPLVDITEAELREQLVAWFVASEAGELEPWADGMSPVEKGEEATQVIVNRILELRNGGAA